MSWKDAYKLRASIGKEDSERNVQELKQIRTSIEASELAKAGFRKSVKDSAPLKQPDAKTESEMISDSLDATIKKGGIEGFGASAAKVAETPVIKEVLNVLTTGAYASANTANNITDAVNNLKDGNVRGISDLLMAPTTGITQGVKAGIGQSRDDAVLYGEVIKKWQEMAGADPENDAAKWTQGLGGFAADVLLDPTTYLTLGASAAAKGAVRGARQGSRTAKELAEAAIAKDSAVADIIPAKSTMSNAQIAANPKGRIRTAIQEAGRDKALWSANRAKAKAEKKLRKSAPVGAAVHEEVGPNIKEFQANIDARSTDEVRAMDDELGAEFESTPIKTADDILAEVEAPKPAVVPEIKEAAVEAKIPETFTQEVKNTIEQLPVKPTVEAKSKLNPQVMEKLASTFMKPKYGKPAVAKELAQPGGAKVIRQVPMEDMPDGSHFMRVPTDAKGKNSTTGFTGRTAESKDKKRAQKNTSVSKTQARLKEEVVDWNAAPRLSDPKYKVLVDENDEGVLINSKNFDEHVDPDVWDNYVAEHGDDYWEIQTDKGVMKQKVSEIDNLRQSANTKVADEYLRQNLDKFVHSLNDYDEYEEYINGLIGEHATDLEKYVSSAKTAKETVEPVIDAEDDGMKLIRRMIEVEEDNPNAWSPERAHALGIDPTDAVLSPAEIAALKLPMTNVQIKAKIKSNTLPKGEMDLLRALTGESDLVKIADKYVDLRKEMAAAIKTAAKPVKVKDSKEKEVARFLEGKDNVQPIKPTDEAINDIQAEATDLAEEFVKSPVAFDEPYQMEFRAKAFRDAVKPARVPDGKGGEMYSHGIPDSDLLKIVNHETGSKGQRAIAEYAHTAVRDALEVQLKEADFRTGSGMRTLTDDKTTGGAWSPKSWGSSSQQALHDSIIRSMGEVFKNPDLKPLSFNKRRFYMAALNIADKELRAAGVEPFLNHIADIKGKARTNVSLYDMFAALDEAGQISTLDKALFHYPSTSLGVTPIQSAVETMLRMRHANMSESLIRLRMKKAITDSQAHRGRPVNHDTYVTNQTTKRLGLIIDHTPALENIADPKLLARAAKKIDAVTVNKMVDSLMDPTVYRSLTYRQMINQAAHNSSLGDFAESYANKMVERLYKIAEVEGPGAAMKLFRSDIGKLQHQISPADYEAGKQALEIKLTETVSEQERAVIETAVKREKIAETTPPKPNTPAATKVMPKVQNEVNKTHVAEAKAATKEIEATPKPDDTELFQMYSAQIASAAVKKMHPIQKLTNPALGLSTDVYRAVNSGLHSIARQQAHFHQTLSMHLEKYSAQVLKADFEELRRMAQGASKGKPFLLTDDMPASMHELYGIIGTVLEVSNKNVFARNGVGVKHFNALAKADGLDDTWKFKEELSIYDNTHLWANEWEGIAEKGVLDFISKMHSVAVKTSQEIAMGASFSKEFGKAAPEAGHVKLRWDNRRGADKDSSFYDLIDHDLYYPKDIAAQVIQVNTLMRESRSLNTSTKTGKFFVNVFDPITNALKASQTTVRPGHWMVSVAGDLLRNQIAGVNSIAPYRHAVHIMRAGGIDPTDFIGKIDSAQALAKYRKSQEIGSNFMVNGEGSGMHFLIGGKKRPMSYESLEKVLRDVVMLPKHRGGGGAVEDRFVGENVTSGLARRLEKATDFVTDNNKFSLNALAAKRDNFMRISLAVDYASKRNWASVSEMKKGMEDYVTKWAPVSTDMTSFESKYARRSMLYYTWLRGITPRIIDSAMTKPGVSTIVPKALYNLAYANGLDPESVGNPFPEDDKLFPSYYYNNVLGPQWKDDYGMWGINPSSPVIEVANTFSKFKPGDPVGNIGGAGKQLIGMSTPFAKMPLEMAMGQQSSGIPIEDNNQYLLDNLGGSYVGALSRATGKTVNQNGIVDRTDSAAKGTPEEQAEQAKLQAMNFLSGMKLTDYKSDSAIKAANYDIVDKMKQKVEAQRRGQ